MPFSVFLAMTIVKTVPVYNEECGFHINTVYYRISLMAHRSGVIASLDDLCKDT